MTSENGQTVAVNGGVGEDVLLNVSNLRMHFPVTSGILLQKTVGHVKGRG